MASPGSMIGASAPKSAGGAQAQILSVLKDLQLAWQRVGETWDDQAKEDFGRRFVEPLEPLAQAAAKAFSQLEELKSRALREC